LRDPGCPCFTCLDKPELGLQNPTNLWMVLCPLCGNKRCPKATSHEEPCTNSNEPGQPGSRYGGEKPESLKQVVSFTLG